MNTFRPFECVGFIQRIDSSSRRNPTIKLYGKEEMKKSRKLEMKRRREEENERREEQKTLRKEGEEK